MLRIIFLYLVLILISTSCSTVPDFTDQSGGTGGVINETGGNNAGGFGGSIGECNTQSDCEENEICLSHSCITVQPSSGGNGGSCAGVNINFEKQIPTVALLIDRSGSMTANDFEPNRWEAVKDALLNPDTGIIISLQEEVSFGLVLYDSNNGSLNGFECPRIMGTAASLNAYEIINTEFSLWDPAGDTPTGDAVTWIVNNFIFQDNQPKAIVLATDGEPDTCEIPNPNDPINNPSGRQESEVAIALAYENDISTFVISVGTETSVQHLEDLANIGSGKDKDDPEQEPVYIADSYESLFEAFETIITGVRSCEIQLEGSIQPGYEDDGTVTIDGEEIIYNIGYRILSPNSIEFIEDSCDLIKSGEHDIVIEFPCGAVITK